MSGSLCTNCGDTLPRGASFCDNCGMPISEVAPTQEAPPQEEVPLQHEPPPTAPPGSSPPPVPPPTVKQPVPDLPVSQEAQPSTKHGHDGRRWRRRRVPILLLLPLLLTVLLGGTAYALIRGTDGTGLPNLIGASSVREPQSTTSEEPSEATESAEEPESTSTVAEQEPTAVQTAGNDLFVSTDNAGKEAAEVPEVRGKARDEAVQLLEEMGFEVEEETVESTAVNEGRVLEQDPRGGEGATAEVGTTVRIRVGSGPSEQSPEKAKSPASKGGSTPKDAGKATGSSPLTRKPGPVGQRQHPAFGSAYCDNFYDGPPTDTTPSGAPTPAGLQEHVYWCRQESNGHWFAVSPDL